VPELAFGPLVPVEAELERVRGVAAHLEEGRPPLRVEEVEVVVVHVHRLAPEREVDVAGPLLLRRGPGPGPLLGDADHHHPGRCGEALPILLDDVVLALALPELDPRDAARFNTTPATAV
jgi:hypothetical protein